MHLFFLLLNLYFSVMYARSQVNNEPISAPINALIILSLLEIIFDFSKNKLSNFAENINLNMLPHILSLDNYSF